MMICGNLERENDFCNLYKDTCNNGSLCRKNGKEYGIRAFSCSCGHTIPMGKPFKRTFQCYACGQVFDLNGNPIKDDLE